MYYVHKLRQYVWLFVLWFVVIGIGVIGAFWEYYQERQIGPNVAPQADMAVFQEEQYLALDTIATPPAYTAQSVWIYDQDSKSILYEDNAHTATSVASLAKLMTAVVSYESFSLDDEVRIGSASAAIGNRAKFFPQDVFSVYDLLHALLIFSANDAAEALSYAYPGGMESFVEAMNVRAAELGLENTQYQNPSGLDDVHQYSSAHDVGRIALEALQVPLLSEIVSQPVKQIRERVSGRVDTVYTTNALLYKGPQYRGMKTGTTELAGESLVVRAVTQPEAPVLNPFLSASESTAQVEEVEPVQSDIVLVLLGSDDRFADAVALVNWVQNTLQLQNSSNF